MGSSTATAAFSSELAVLFVAIGLLAMLVIRPEQMSRSALSATVLAAGFALLGAEAVLRGALLEPNDDLLLVSLRLGAMFFMLLGWIRVLPGWRRTLALGLAGFAAGEIAFAADLSQAGDILRTFGATCVAWGLWRAARRTVAARVAAASALVLLGLVLSTSTVLSTALPEAAGREAAKAARATAEKDAARVQGAPLSGVDPRLLVAAAKDAALRRFAANGDVASISQAVADIRREFPDSDWVAFMDAHSQILASDGLDPRLTSSVPGAAAASTALAPGSGSVASLAALRAATEARPSVFLVQSIPVDTVSHGRIGVLLVAERLEGQFVPPAAGFGDGTLLRDIRGAPIAAVEIVSSPGAAQLVRESLQRTLFLVAFGGALITVVLVLMVAMWMGRPLGRVTEAARRIQRGDLRSRVGLRRDDEVGVLAEAFDAMADSIELQAAELRHAAEQMEAVLTNMTEALIATDSRGSIVSLNPAARALVAGAAPGAALSSVLTAVDEDGNELAACVESPPEVPWTRSATMSDADAVPIAVSASPIRGEGGGSPTGAVYVIRDLRREREVERMKTEFLSNISHELRTPLTPIKGYSNILLTRSVPRARAKAFLESIIEASGQLERYIDMLVNFSAMESGSISASRQPVDVGDLVLEAAGRWRERSAKHQIEVKVQRNLPEFPANRRLVKAALDELVANAIKYSPKGGPIGVRVLAGSRDEAGRVSSVDVVVADEGIGIKPEDMERIFTGFAQADGSTTRRFGGMGLGLKFVSRVARAHGGLLNVNSAPGAGSTFTLGIPVRGLEPSVKGPKPRSRRSPPRVVSLRSSKRAASGEKSVVGRRRGA